MTELKDVIQKCICMMADAPYEYIGIVHANRTYSVMHQSKFFSIKLPDYDILCLVPKWFIETYGWSPLSDNEKHKDMLYNFDGNYWRSRSDVMMELTDPEIGEFPETYDEAIETYKKYWGALKVK